MINKAQNPEPTREEIIALVGRRRWCEVADRARAFIHSAPADAIISAEHSSDWQYMTRRPTPGRPNVGRQPYYDFRVIAASGPRGSGYEKPWTFIIAYKPRNGSNKCS